MKILFWTLDGRKPATKTVAPEPAPLDAIETTLKTGIAGMSKHISRDLLIFPRPVKPGQPGRMYDIVAAAAFGRSGVVRTHVAQIGMIPEPDGMGFHVIAGTEATFHKDLRGVFDRIGEECQKHSWGRTPRAHTGKKPLRGRKQACYPSLRSG